MFNSTIPITMTIVLLSKAPAITHGVFCDAQAVVYPWYICGMYIYIYYVVEHGSSTAPSRRGTGISSKFLLGQILGFGAQCRTAQNGMFNGGFPEKLGGHPYFQWTPEDWFSKYKMHLASGTGVPSWKDGVSPYSFWSLDVIVQVSCIV